MGICCSFLQNDKNIYNVKEVDEIIILSYAFMKNKISEEQIEKLLPTFLFDQLIEEKSDPIKTRDFFKWINMSIHFKRVIFSMDINNIINSVQNENNDENKTIVNLKNKEISYIEVGLRKYYRKNKLGFENHVIKSASGTFRWISWEILCNLPETRDSKFYEKLITKKIKKWKKNEISLEIEYTIEESCTMVTDIKTSLFRLLKSLIIIDQEIIELNGISYIIAYLLFISNLDELNIFYFMISLLSKTFTDKFNLRGFYIKDQPLLKACKSVFQKYFDKHFPELNEHFQEINLPLSAWIIFWIQMCYINLFPIRLLLRIWDYFLVYGISFLLSLGLSIVEDLYEDLINKEKPEYIIEFFKKLNPDLKSKNKMYEMIGCDIERLINNAIKNYPISNEEIIAELQTLFPNYNNNFKYEYNDQRKSLSSIEKEIPIIYNKYILETDNTEDNNTNNTNNSQNYCNLININDITYNILEENQIENIELSVTENKKVLENYFSENSCEEIEDENIKVNEHIKDLMSKQSCLNRKSNSIK